MGRPSDYSEQIANEICERIIEGESLLRICSNAAMPNRVTIYRWMQAHAAFRNNYARAREAQADYYNDLIREVAFDDSGDFFVEDGKIIADHARVQRARLKVDSLKWQAARQAPRRYGDRLAIEPGDADPPAEPVHRIERVIIGASEGYLAKRVKELEEQIALQERRELPRHDPVLLLGRADSHILMRMVEMVKRAVPRADQGSPEKALEKVLAVCERAIKAEFGSESRALGSNAVANEALGGGRSRE